MSVQDHEDLVSEVTCLRESLTRMQSALDQFAAERKQLREILDQRQRARDQASNQLDQLREQINRLGSIYSVGKRLGKVRYNLTRLDGQLELLTKMHLPVTTSLLHTQAPSFSRKEDRDMA